MIVKSELDIDAVIYTTRIYIDGITMWFHQRHKETEREGSTCSSMSMERLWKDVMHPQHLKSAQQNTTGIWRSVQLPHLDPLSGNSLRRKSRVISSNTTHPGHSTGTVWKAIQNHKVHQKQPEEELWPPSHQTNATVSGRSPAKLQLFLQKVSSKLGPSIRQQERGVRPEQEPSGSSRSGLTGLGIPRLLSNPKPHTTTEGASNPPPPPGPVGKHGAAPASKLPVKGLTNLSPQTLALNDNNGTMAAGMCMCGKMVGLLVSRRDQSKRTTQQKLSKASPPYQHQCSQCYSHQCFFWGSKASCDEGPCYTSSQNFCSKSEDHDSQQTQYSQDPPSPPSQKHPCYYQAEIPAFPAKLQLSEALPGTNVRGMRRKGNHTSAV
ncbi:hypothetical protein D4764_06G0010380 [Takifugu flavidus]|uniref:Uncharacterized protein n=1 Tax=Takifugu flavidus TaxID=433684 RepID=A0A5C6MYL5_9TELE|nr:hypothetical protein D4764_06G0010380 [Takifugu flavidus]